MLGVFGALISAIQLYPYVVCSYTKVCSAISGVELIVSYCYWVL